MNTAAAPQRRERATAALRHRDFRLLWAGEFVSTLGTQMQTVAIGWQLYQLTGSPLQLGVLGLIRAIPVVAFSLVGGTLADSRDRRRLLLVTQVLIAAFSALLALATALDAASVGLIYLVTLLTTIVSCFDDPARQALIPQLVPHQRIAQATTLNILTHNIAAVVGPAAGGLAVAHLGIAATYALDAASFLAVILALLAMHARPEVPVLAGGGIDRVLEGLRFVRRSPVILPLMLLDFLATFFGASLVLLPIFAEEILRVGADGLGLLYAAPAAGAVGGGLVLAALPAARRPGRLVLLAVALYGLAVAIFGASDSFIIALAALAGAGAADTLSMTMRHTIRQLATPDGLRGRVAAVHSVFAGGGPELGNFEAGVTARLFGVQEAVVLGGIASIAIAGIVALFSPGIRTYSTERAPEDARAPAVVQARGGDG